MNQEGISDSAWKDETNPSEIEDYSSPEEFCSFIGFSFQFS